MPRRAVKSGTVIQAYVPFEQVGQIEKAARAGETTVSDIVRRALALYFSLPANSPESREKADA